MLEPRLARDGVIVVVDAADVRERAADRRVGDTVTRQLAAADLLVLNKVDLAQDLAGAARLAADAFARRLSSKRVTPMCPSTCCSGSTVTAASAGDGPADSFASWSYEWPEPVEREIVLAMLRDATGVLRAKGIVRFADAPGRRSVVHLVGRRLDVNDDGPWSDNATSRLVLLGLKPRLCLPG